MSAPVYSSLSSFNPSPFDLQLLFQLSTSTQDAVAQTVDAVRLIIASVLQLRGIVASQQCELDQLRSEINRLRGLPLPVVGPPFAGFESIGVGSSFGLSVSGPPLYVPDAPLPVDQMAVSTPAPAPAPVPFPIFSTPGIFPAPTPFPIFSTPGTFPIPSAPGTFPIFPTPDRFPTTSTENAYFPAATANTPLFPAPATPPRSMHFSTVDPPSRPKHPLPPAPFLWGAPAETPYSRR